MRLRVCLAGATGWAGAPLARAVAHADDLELVGAVARRQAGQSLGQVLGDPLIKVTLSGTADEALKTACDVFVEYTHPEAAKANVSAAIRRGANVVIGTSGLPDADLDELGALAQERGVGVLAVGNFSIAYVLMLKSAELAAKYLAQWELVDYANAGKVDSPSGTARELAYRLSNIRRPEMTVPIEKMQGPREARGATMNGMQVHSVRLPGYPISVAALFGVDDQKLSIRFEGGNSAEPYVQGALLAIRRAGSFVGLKRGLDRVMEF